MFTQHQEYKLGIPFYHQTLPTSCLSACMLMVGNFFDPGRFPLVPLQENEMHRKVRFWEGDAAGDLGSMAKLIRLARESGFWVKYFLEGPHGAPSDLSVDLWERYLTSFLQILEEEKGKDEVVVIDGCRLEDLLHEVSEGRPVICEVKLRAFITHAIVMRGLRDNMVYVVDPLGGYERIPRQQLEEKIDLGYMKNALSLVPKKQA